MADEESSSSAVSLVETSPYTYAAIGCFFIAACSSDLLILRLTLMSAFALLALANWSNHAPDGSFSSESLPFVEGDISLPILLYTMLFVWNLGACLSLLDDARPRRKLANPHDQALYNYFRRNCGLSRLEFDEIRMFGKYVELGANEQVPFTDSTLYLVLEGLVECETRERRHPSQVAAMFPKRSGQFFDLKFFNIFSLPVGFDSLHFRATTSTRTRLFGWSVRALATMRDSKSPHLRPFWEFMILRAMARDSIRHHLQAADASENAWPLPESQEWWDGLPSSDFEEPKGRIYRPPWFHFLPPKGIRNSPPSIPLEQHGQQECIEIVAKAKQECMDRMQGDEGSWQNVLFMSTFGCFKESSVEEETPASTPAKSTPGRSNTAIYRSSAAEEPTNRPSLGVPSSDSMLPQTPQGRRSREYDGNIYTSLSRESQDATPRVSNHFVSNSVQMRQQPLNNNGRGDGQSVGSVPQAPAVDAQSVSSHTGSYAGVPQFSVREPAYLEQQSTNAEATSTVRSELEEEVKAEIEPEPPAQAPGPVFEALWQNAPV